MQVIQGHVEDLWTSYSTFAKFQDGLEYKLVYLKKEITVEEEVTHNERLNNETLQPFFSIYVV